VLFVGLQLDVKMIKLLEIYNNLVQQVEDWAFKYVIPPALKLIEITLKLTMLYAFYLLIVNTINELF
tara:strand:- start:254 stop:454 length:201 start_codon:yes stop_codon:yes gene_type:complete